eukprot:Skav206597  [mRNA]  locus=scaffold4512:80754:81002:- [translate_table: standard]
MKPQPFEVRLNPLAKSSLSISWSKKPQSSFKKGTNADHQTLPSIKCSNIVTSLYTGMARVVFRFGNACFTCSFTNATTCFSL